MYRDYRLYLEDILEAIRKIKEYTDKTDERRTPNIEH